MRVRVRFTATALRNLSAIGEYIARDDSESAVSVVGRVYDAARELARHPGKGRPGRIAGTRELLIPGLPYIVVYREKDAEAQVLRVLHSARLWPRVLS